MPVEAPLKVKGRVWLVDHDNIDTDMIYHNRHLAVTDIGEMGKYCFGNLEGWEDFAEKAKPGDVVVTGSNFARYKGLGTINGTGDYKFMLWAGDGTGTDDADTFRIKIWYEDGGEIVVYDNGMDQEIGGGSIVVHTKK